jgi:anion-transporting  ArsA/GET3 family ATPase
LLQRFIDSFCRAVTGEMESMRERMGPHEIPATDGEQLDDAPGRDRVAYRFRLHQSSDKLVQGGECNLVTDRSDVMVTVVSFDGDRIVLSSDRPLDLPDGRATLVIYPWFLYERLQETLRGLGEHDGFHTDTALSLFGNAPACQLTVSGATTDHLADSLNASQREAVELCLRTTPAFIWGPPGTGKTTTLGYIVLSLLQRGQRVLVTSTTNAAVDQALSRLAQLEDGGAAIDRGEVVRLGQTQADTHGAGLPQVVERLYAETHTRIAALEQRQARRLHELTVGNALLADLRANADASQLGLFGTTNVAAVDPERLASLLRRSNATRLATLSVEQQTRLVERRLGRLEQAVQLSVERSQQLRHDLRTREGAVVSAARLVLATMTNVYMSSLMSDQRFDAVIVEEAGMAVLPILFYCASLAKSRVIMVGDPQQLPPIVQSSEPFVQRAMGRNIFDITVPEPHRSELVVMLDTQYRMHPRIGDLVGGLFYDGRLRHGDVTRDTNRIAAFAPCPGAAIVVVDTNGSSICDTPARSYSRFNEGHAAIAVDMARQAVEAGAGSVAIIAPYVEQVRLIGRLLAANPALSDRVECRTVHRFQGGERDVVVVDTVDAEPLPPGRLLSDRRGPSSAANLINVSVSRARGKLVIIADAPYFRRRDPAGIIDRVLTAAQELGTIVSP